MQSAVHWRTQASRTLASAQARGRPGPVPGPVRQSWTLAQAQVHAALVCQRNAAEMRLAIPKWNADGTPIQLATICVELTHVASYFPN